MQPLLRFFQIVEDPDQDSRVVVEHLEHPRKAELNPAIRDQRRSDRRSDFTFCPALRHGEDFFETYIDPIERREIRDPVDQHPCVLQPLDLCRHCIEVRSVQHPEQACGVVVAFVANLEGHGRSLKRHAQAKPSSSLFSVAQAVSTAAVTAAVAGRMKRHKEK